MPRWFNEEKIIFLAAIGPFGWSTPPKNVTLQNEP